MFLQLYNKSIINLNIVSEILFQVDSYTNTIKFKNGTETLASLHFNQCDYDKAECVYDNIIYILKHNKRFTTEEELETKNFKEVYGDV